ncbi:MAG: hypothetical protein AABZ06_01940 [Bdellovibrionota bacterium]
MAGVNCTDFTRIENTIVVSDIHLTDAEPPHPRNPLWKRFKRPAHFVDRKFTSFLEHLCSSMQGPIELILNGDIFDFDSVMALPEKPRPHLTWLEKVRGLAPEEPKSRFKIQVIMADHAIWMTALRNFILAGNRVIFIIGNHDVELHWPSVRQDIIDKLDLPEERRSLMRFCEWFYISNQDTLIEHGNQYDHYSLILNPVNPLIKKGAKIYMRIPFGNLAGKFMLNGIGLMNPHADSSYIKNSFWEYILFYYKYVMRTQPLLIWTWFWSAMVTLVYSLSEGLLPAMRDPLTMDARVQEIADRANTTPQVVWTLKEVHVHPAVFNPVKVLQELWLDRAILLGLIVVGSFQFFSVLNVFVAISIWWFVTLVVLLMPAFIFYARSVVSGVMPTIEAALRLSPLSARIARVKRVVHGHTHIEQHTSIDGIEYLNTGTWSAAYHDVECTKPYGRKCFAWIKPGGPDGNRIAELYEWKDDGIERIQPVVVQK